MADWENIPRLDPALQDEIDNVQLKHTELVEAVRGYSGGSIAGKTNEVMGTHQDDLDTVATREKTLISAVGQPEPSPSMLLDFASQTYFTGIRGLEQAVDPHKYLDVSRATHKWVMGPQGRLVEVPPDTLAYEYDPVTGEPLGVSIERGRTNLIVGSEDTVNWSTNPPVTYSLVTGEVVNPAGGNTAIRLDKVAAESPSSYRYTGDRGPWHEGDTVTASWFFKAGSHERVTFNTYFNDSTGENNPTLNLETGEVTGSVQEVASLTVERYSYGWFRASLTVTCQADGSSFAFRCWPCGRGNSAGSGYIYVWGAQLEEAAPYSTYIPTTDSPVTRAADTVSKTLEREANPSQFTMFYEYTGAFADSDATNFNSGPDRIWVMPVRNTTLNQVVFVPQKDGNRLYTIISSELPWGTRKRVAFSVDTNTGQVIFAVNGVIEDSRIVGDLPVYPTDPTIGSSRHTTMAQWVHYPYAMSETELQELTANG